MRIETLADRLKAAMKENNITQAELAEAVGLAQPTIWRLVNGKAEGSTKLVNIAKALGVSVDWLSGGVGNMYSDPTSEQRQRPVTYSNVVPVSVWENEHKTDQIVFAPNLIATKTVRAYKIVKNTGISEVPAETLIIIDTAEQAGNQDIVYACINNNYSVYKYIEGGTGYLSVDDSRVPLIPVSDTAEIIGVVVYLSRELKRKK